MVAAMFRTLTSEERKLRREAKAAKPVSKRTNALTPRPKARQIVVTVYPAGTIGLRPLKCRQEELIDIAAAYSRAVKERVAYERAQRKLKRKGG